MSIKSIISSRLVRTTFCSVLSNINGLGYHTVYVLKDSYLYDMIKDLPGIDIQTYATPTDLKKIASKEAIIVLDSNTSKYYLTKLTNNYTSRYSSF